MKSIFFFVAISLLLCVVAVISSINATKLFAGQQQQKLRQLFNKQQGRGSKNAGCPLRPPLPISPSEFFKHNISIPDSILADIELYLRNQISPCSTKIPPIQGRTTATAFSAAVVFGVQVKYINFGCTDKVTKKTVTKDNLFMVASISKTYVAYGLLEATHSRDFSKRKIRSLDDPINMYCPEFEVTNRFSPNNEQPTWRELASQLSGLRREVPCNVSKNCNVTLDQVLERLKSTGPLILPGMFRPAYSNLGYDLLGQILTEKIYKEKSFGDYLKKYITGPLGMNSTGVDLDSEIAKKNLVTGYESGGAASPPFIAGFGQPDGGIFTSAVDAAKWTKMWLKNYSSNSATRMFMLPQFMDFDSKTGFGLPFELYRTTSENSSNYLMVTKSGDLSGYNAQFVLSPELSFGIFAMFNGVGLPFTFPVDIGNMIIPRLEKMIFELFYQQLIPETPVSVGLALKNTKWKATGVPLEFSLELAESNGFSSKLIKSGTLMMITRGFGNYFLIPVENNKNNNNNNDFVFSIQVAPTSAQEMENSPIPCILEEFIAVQGEYVFVHPNFLKIDIPGLFYDQPFFRS